MNRYTEEEVDEFFAGLNKIKTPGYYLQNYLHPVEEEKYVYTVGNKSTIKKV